MATAGWRSGGDGENNLRELGMMRSLLGRFSSEPGTAEACVSGRSREGPLSASKIDNGQVQVESRRHEQLGK